MLIFSYLFYYIKEILYKLLIIFNIMSLIVFFLIYRGEIKKV